MADIITGSARRPADAAELRTLVSHIERGAILALLVLVLVLVGVVLARRGRSKPPRQSNVETSPPPKLPELILGRSDFLNAVLFVIGICMAGGVRVAASWGAWLAAPWALALGGLAFWVARRTLVGLRTGGDFLQIFRLNASFELPRKDMTVRTRVLGRRVYLRIEAGGQSVSIADFDIDPTGFDLWGATKWASTDRGLQQLQENLGAGEWWTATPLFLLSHWLGETPNDVLHKSGREEDTPTMTTMSEHKCRIVRNAAVVFIASSTLSAFVFFLF